MDYTTLKDLFEETLDYWAIRNFEDGWVEQIAQNDLSLPLKPVERRERYRQVPSLVVNVKGMGFHDHPDHKNESEKVRMADFEINLHTIGTFSDILYDEIEDVTGWKLISRGRMGGWWGFNLDQAAARMDNAVACDCFKIKEGAFDAFKIYCQNHYLRIVNLQDEDDVSDAVYDALKAGLVNKFWELEPSLKQAMTMLVESVIATDNNWKNDPYLIYGDDDSFYDRWR